MLARSRLSVELDLLLTDVIVQREPCFSLLEYAQAHLIAPRIIAIGSHAPPSYVFLLRDYGVQAYLDKPIAPSQLSRALAHLIHTPDRRTAGPAPWIRDLDRNPSPPRANVVQPRNAEATVSAAPRGVRAGESPTDDRYHPSMRLGNDSETLLTSWRGDFGLTSAEMEVLRCAIAGLNRDEIAASRGVSVNTVKTQIRGILNRTGARHIRDLLAHVRRHKLTSP